MSSCNGCRALRKGCSDSCILRACLEWIPSPQAQSNATLFVARFFGRSDLMSFVSSVPLHQRAALFQSLLYEACGRTINPVSGAVGLLSTGNWHLCQAGVEAVLAGGCLQPISTVTTGTLQPNAYRQGGCDSGSAFQPSDLTLSPTGPRFSTKLRGRARAVTSVTMTTGSGGGGGDRRSKMMEEDSEGKLLNLFV